MWLAAVLCPSIFAIPLAEALKFRLYYVLYHNVETLKQDASRWFIIKGTATWFLLRVVSYQWSKNMMYIVPSSLEAWSLKGRDAEVRISEVTVLRCSMFLIWHCLQWLSKPLASWPGLRIRLCKQRRAATTGSGCELEAPQAKLVVDRGIGHRSSRWPSFKFSLVI
jgi:hypothetical protein